MNEVAQVPSNVPVDPAIKAEAEALVQAASEDASFDKLLKFKKGEYVSNEVIVPWGKRFIAHCVGYTKVWLKFGDGNLLERRTYSGLDRKLVIPKRDQLDDNDPSKWTAKRPDGSPSDPWVFQCMIPLEAIDGDDEGEISLFVSQSFGGKRAIADLVKSYAARSVRMNNTDQPVIELSGGTFPSPKFGKVPCPHLKIVGWDHFKAGMRTVSAPDTLKDEMADEIPF
jgi:hypothetical protein